ncbi:type II toxin-antitoxin system VapC family toxin [Jiella sp. M17.18]|uniref:type II toxin-antitoxin system VapC family toxin n=1 Tax=Jiella sp. M17.18 TaxID=3234247 RepID=UPI0034E01DE6
MIAVDTSALIAVILRQGQWQACDAALRDNRDIVISAGTVAEALIVAGRKAISQEMVTLFEGFDFEIEPVTAFVARQVAIAYERWGKGNHPARLNFGDCFAYELATRRACPLLFVGDDFAKTDVRRAF